MHQTGETRFVDTDGARAPIATFVRWRDTARDAGHFRGDLDALAGPTAGGRE